VNRWLIQFDVRAAKEQYVSHRWDAKARARYLLRPDIEWPLSVDGRVWPSVFYSELVERSDSQSYATIEVDPAIDDGHYWLDLAKMRAHYDLHRALAPGGVFVGVELLSEKEAEDQTLLYVLPEGIQCGLSLGHTVPERPPERSILLGYDVANVGWISGVANTEYTEEEIRDLAPVWAHRLNSFGLLDTQEDAVAFRQVCDERDPGSAPFWIYGLWRLPVG
jgi:hypothetical protein